MLRLVDLYDADQLSEETALFCPEESRTRQEFKEESDINTIIDRFGIGENPIEAQKWVTDVDIAPPDPALRNTDPFAYDEQLAAYTHASHQKEVAAKERQKLQAEHQQLQERRYNEFASQREAELREKAPELFGPKGKEIGMQIQEYAQKVGYSPEQLRMAEYGRGLS